MLEPVRVGSAGLSPEAIIRDRKLIADFTDTDGRHLVIADEAGRHRLIVRDPQPRTGHACMVLPDAWRAMRLAAVSSLFQPPASASKARMRQPLHPSELQKHRLTAMLGILDCFTDGNERVPTVREIARRAIYPWDDFGRSIEWKTSSERRQTQRLVNEARRLAAGGYIDLLKGNTRASRLQDT